MKKQMGVLLMFMVVCSAVSAQDSNKKADSPMKDLCVKRITHHQDSSSTGTGIINVAYYGELGSKNKDKRYDFEAEPQQNLDSKNIYYKDTTTSEITAVKKPLDLKWPFQKSRERGVSVRRSRNESRENGKASRNMNGEDGECI